MRTATVMVSAGLLILVLVGGIVYLAVYLDSHKGLLEAGASRALGRQVKVEEGVTLVWSMPPLIGLDGVRVANPGWAQGEYFARAERIAARVDIWALLRGRVEIRHLTLLHADIALEAGPGGENNWTFGAGRHGGMGFRVDWLQVRDSSLRYQSVTGPQHKIDITELELQSMDGERLALQAQIRLRGVAMAVAASAGPSAREGWPFSARIHTEDGALQVSGRAIEPFAVSGITMELDASGQDLRSLQPFFGPQQLPEGSFQLGATLTAREGRYQVQRIHGAIDAPGGVDRFSVGQGEVTFADEGLLKVSLEGSWNNVTASVALDFERDGDTAGDGKRKLDLTARLGDTELTGNLGFVASGPRRRITGDLSATRVNLSHFAGAVKDSDPRRNWREVPLPRALLGAVDLDLTIKGQGVVSNRLQVGGYQARVRLDGGHLQVDGLDASLPGLRVTGRGTLDTLGEPPTLAAELRSHQVELPKALQGRLPPDRLQGSLRGVSARLKSGGATLGDLIASLRGTIEASSGRLQLPGPSPTDIVLERPRISLAPSSPLGLRTGLTFREQNLAIQGNLGRLPDLLAGGPVRVDLTVRDRDLTARVDGTLAKLDELNGSNLAVELSGSSLARLGPIFGTELPNSQRFGLTGRLAVDTGSWRFNQIKVVSGDSRLGGEVRIVWAPKLRLEATLDSRLLDATPYLPEGRRASLDDITTALAREVPLEWLHKLDGALHLTAGHVRFGEFGLDDFNLNTALDAGHLRLKMEAGEERVIADVQIKPQETQWRLTLKHKSTLNLGWLLEAGQPSTASADEAPLALDVHLSAVGGSPRALLASADGHLELVLGAGRFNKKAGGLMPMGGVFVTLLDTISPSSREAQYGRLECAVIRMEVAKGIATSPEGFALRTDEINVLGGGAVKLETGEIDFRFKTAQRRGLGISILGTANKFIHFTGTLRHPKVAVDPLSLLLQGAAAWATAGLSLLYEDVVKRLTAFVNPCALVLGGKPE